jgi:hypothetical protein
MVLVMLDGEQEVELCHHLECDNLTEFLSDSVGPGTDGAAVALQALETR